MSERFSNGRPAPWWRRPSHLFIASMMVAATLLGLWLYQTNGAVTTTEPVGVTEPDAVQVVLRAGKPTIIEFGANNCVSCREMKPILHTLALDPRIVVADIDVLKERKYISGYQIRLMPTQVFYNAQGVETGRHMGKISADDILAQLGMAAAGTTPTAAPTKAAL